MWVKLEVFKEHFLPEFSAGSQFVVLNSCREIPKGLKESLKTCDISKNSTEGWSGQFGLWDLLQHALHSAYTVIHIKPIHRRVQRREPVPNCNIVHYNLAPGIKLKRKATMFLYVHYFLLEAWTHFSIFIVEGRWFLRSVDLPLMHIIPYSQPEIKNRCLGQKSFQTLTRPVQLPVWARSGGTFSCSWGGAYAFGYPWPWKKQATCGRK